MIGITIRKIVNGLGFWRFEIGAADLRAAFLSEQPESGQVDVNRICEWMALSEPAMIVT